MSDYTALLMLFLIAGVAAGYAVGRFTARTTDVTEAELLESRIKQLTKPSKTKRDVYGRFAK